MPTNNNATYTTSELETLKRKYPDLVDSRGLAMVSKEELYELARLYPTNFKQRQPPVSGEPDAALKALYPTMFTS